MEDVGWIETRIPCYAITKNGSILSMDDVDYAIPPHPQWGRHEKRDLAGFGPVSGGEEVGDLLQRMEDETLTLPDRVSLLGAQRDDPELKQMMIFLEHKEEDEKKIGPRGARDGARLGSSLEKNYRTEQRRVMEIKTN